jgi:23S rRNA pseudouridine2605 synthase
MENRKPGGRPFGKNERTGGKELRSRRPADNTSSKSEKTTGRDLKGRKSNASTPGRYEKPAGKDLRSRRTEEKNTGRPNKQLLKGKKTEPEKIRLNRFIANSGVCSRRDADEHIKNGLVSVNGHIVTDMGIRVTYDDDVRFRNKRLSAEKKVYILMNKPKDYVTTVEDPHAEHTVLDLIGDDCPERVYPVGRLDKATTGVLLLTNDGDLAGKLTHPKFKRKKIYHVFLDNAVTKNDLFKLTEGIELDGVTVVADAVSYADPDDKSQIGIELHSGQNRVIRRMFESLGYKVKKLDRVYFAGLTKKNVQRGKWRFLTDKEVSMLKRGIF